MSATPEAQPSRALVIGTVSFYMVSGIIMVTANKYVLVKSSIPIFFLFAQLSIAVVLLCVSHVFGIFVIPTFNSVTVKKLWKLIALNVTGLCFNNFTLQYVDASFYQVARGLVLPLTVIITYIAYKKLPTSLALGACGCVTVGFFVGVLFGGGATKVSSLGVMFGVLSSLTTACHAIVIKDSLKAVDGSTMALAWYSNALSAIVMLPISIVCAEGPEILRTWTDVELLRRFLWGTAVTGVFGFLICIAGFMSIKVTSPVSHMVSSAARGVIQTIVGVWLFNDVVTSGRGLSIGTIIAGSCLYVYAKSKEQAAPPPAYVPVAMDELEEGRAVKPETAADGGDEPHERRD